PGGGSRRRAESQPPPTAKEFLFVYGTLRRGHPGHWRLGTARFVADATVNGTLFDRGRYPALVLGGEGIARGEVWECTAETLRALDAYEAVEEGLFERVWVSAGGRGCWTYVAGAKLASAIARSHPL